MPCVRIATGLWARGKEPALMEAVQSAPVAAVRLPEGDRDVVLDLYGEDRRIVLIEPPPGNRGVMRGIPAPEAEPGSRIDA